MRIGVISDTHMPRRAKTLPQFVREAFANVDHIFHAGDINDWSVLRELNQLAPTIAVAGNTDSPAMTDILGEKVLREVNGFRIGLIHGHLGTGRTTPERARNSFPNADVIIFGHSHQPYNQRHGKQLLLNPGSATDPRGEPRASVAILYLELAGPRAEIVYAP
ncbi:MAG: metallophosphoesterase family protein [Firmicutes bacterium]|nr:metallophosphoesterase family protein [Bacillota bacterium]